MPEISGRARHSCARHRFGGQGTARPTCAAWRCRGGCVNRLNCSSVSSPRYDVPRTRTAGSAREGDESNALQFISALRRYAIG